MRTINVFNENPYWLQDAHYTCKTMYCAASDSNVITDAQGRKILPSGTIWPSNASGVNADGVVLRDVEIEPGEPGATFSCLTHGHINKHYFPVATISATLPATIVFADGSVAATGGAVGYNVIECAAPASITAGSVAAGTTFSVVLSIASIGGAGYSWNSAAQVGDFKIGNATYPLAISAVAVSGSNATLTVKASKAFVASSGVVVAVSAKGSALKIGTDPAPFDSNTVIGLKV